MTETARNPVFLLVEDIAVNLMLLKKLISITYPDAQILLAVNGQQAIEALETAQPDLIFMDVHMPVMDGLNATRSIRLLPKFINTPVVALTAGISPEERESCMQAGMTDYLTKPISITDLQEVFKKYLK